MHITVSSVKGIGMHAETEGGMRKKNTRTAEADSGIPRDRWSVDEWACLDAWCPAAIAREGACGAHRAHGRGRRGAASAVGKDLRGGVLQGHDNSRETV